MANGSKRKNFAELVFETFARECEANMLQSCRNALELRESVFAPEEDGDVSAIDASTLSLLDLAIAQHLLANGNAMFAIGYLREAKRSMKIAAELGTEISDLQSLTSAIEKQLPPVIEWPIVISQAS